MNISVCITVLNEEASTGKLLDSLLNQTKKADEIVIVDGGSTDRTIEIINHYQKRFSGIKLLKEKCTRGKGRNLAVEIAKSEIIAMTDAGCVARPDWVEKITEPLLGIHPPGIHSATLREASVYKEFPGKRLPAAWPQVSRGVDFGIDVVAGFYKMIAKNPMQEAMRVFLGVMSSKFNINFLPSTRSIAFTKTIWEKVRGFPEELNTAEDTVFNYKLIKSGAKISRVKDAVVEWGMPRGIYDVGCKIYEYARGDAKSKIWIFPGKDSTSHNIKAFLIVLRYLLGFGLLVLSFRYNTLPYLFIGLFVYLVYAFRKAGWWGIPLQFVADAAVIIGFIHGLFESRFEGN